VTLIGRHRPDPRSCALLSPRTVLRRKRHRTPRNRSLQTTVSFSVTLAGLTDGNAPDLL